MQPMRLNATFTTFAEVKAAIEAGAIATPKEVYEARPAVARTICAHAKILNAINADVAPGVDRLGGARTHLKEAFSKNNLG